MNSRRGFMRLLAALPFFNVAEVLAKGKPRKWIEGTNTRIQIARPPTIIHFSKTADNLPSPPLEKVNALADCVNDAAFLGAGAGHLLFKGATGVRLIAGEIDNWSVTYEFIYSSQPWRKAGERFPLSADFAKLGIIPRCSPPPSQSTGRR